MQTITENTTVGAIVKAFPGHTRILDSLGIDYCCGGKVRLIDVCLEKGLDPSAIIAMLSASDQPGDAEPASNVDGMSLSELCDHIEEVHHGYLRQELPRLDFLANKVAAVHGEHEPRLLEIRDLFAAFSQKMASHTHEEDSAIFPAIRKLETKAAGEKGAPDTLGALLDNLVAEHDRTGAALMQFQTLTDGYAPPERACNSFRALYEGLEHLEKETHQHVHKENNLLFPKARAAL